MPSQNIRGNRDLPSGQHRPELDGIRGIAIFLVLVWHYAVILVEPDSTWAYAMRGLWLSWTGVDLFFVLSGFLIAGILIDNQKAENYFKVFYVRRICRIFPLYFSWLLLFYGLLFATQHFSLQDLTTLVAKPLPLWSYATFSQNFLMFHRDTFGPVWMESTWSLAIEEQFYLTLPFIIRYSEPRKLPYLLVGFILVAPLLRIALSFSFPSREIATYVLMPCRADALLLGALGAWIVRQQQITRLLVLASQPKALFGTFIILQVGTLSFIKYDPLISYPWRFVGYTWVALLYACFLLIAVNEKGGIIRIITMKSLLRRLGIIAYGIYLFHQGILGLMHGLILHQAPKIHNVQDVMVTIVALALTVALANLSWKFFEKPLVAMGHGFQYQKRQ